MIGFASAKTGLNGKGMGWKACHEFRFFSRYCATAGFFETPLSGFPASDAGGVVPVSGDNMALISDKLVGNEYGRCASGG